LIVISPHLDDAVFACGALLAAHPGSLVVTLFAGVPEEARQRQTAWDARSGFADAADAMLARREEDRRALALLEARPLWLEFSDSQYGASPTADALSATLQQTLRGLAPETLLYPLGLFHSDHRLAHAASRVAANALPGLRPLLYEDALYRGMRGVLQQRLAELAQAGCSLTPARLPSGAGGARKAQAVQAYASQLRALGPDGYADTAQAERYWRFDPAGERPEDG
jgi:LmbE family N-acetylglucosaminyl deacetylase